ncbi:winged helix-turn-helix domain-containing protein [Paenibacillus luteus]|uniref:winged helix-turn-helix domain-containing protein n=1 Tax=Paenibacillus luteus TaxID=2545753 RepID=UPI0019D5C9C3|nr:winged helix-turn-helix domain-containing protein [Paenibacillus luteus]
MNGLVSLVMGVTTDAPEWLTPEQTMLSKLSHEVWVPAISIWTMALAVAYVKSDIEQSCTITSVDKSLHRLDLLFTRTMYTLEATDEGKQTKFVRERFPTKKD